MKIRYFDHAATTPVDKEVLETMLPYLRENFGNPSSIYSIGRENKEAIENARRKVAKAINAKPEEIYFTSCGSESDNLAIKGIAYANRKKGNHIITTKIEHPAVLNTCRNLEKEGFRVTYLSPDKYGMINFKELESYININTILITIMFANNEIGTIEPIKEIGEIAKKHNVYFHTDAVQAIGNIKIDVRDMNIDSLSMSGHKFYAPKGIGALYIRSGIEFERLQDGGHQESDKRAGTENVAGIVGIGKAIEKSNDNLEEKMKRVENLREYFIKNVEEKIPFVTINGDRNKRLPGNINIAFKGVSGENLLAELDKKGICASSGSACSAGLLNPSHVLLAIGVPLKMAKSSLRITIGKENTKEDIDYLIDNLVEIVQKLRDL